MLRISAKNTAALFLICGTIGVFGCASKSAWKDPGLSYQPKEFVKALRARAPELSEDQTVTPFAIPIKTKRLARERIRLAPGGQDPIQILVSILTDPKPVGLGIEYDWAVSATAKKTLELGRGDCVSLAMLLVGIGRSLNWPIYFAEARPPEPVTHAFQELTVLSSHMIVIVLTQEGPVMVDFLGLIDKSEYDIHPIGDLSAYAHLMNNVAGHSIANNDSADLEAWNFAKARFQLVTQIEPNLGRGWNNLGIAHYCRS